jgi:hypothetical protein
VNSLRTSCCACGATEKIEFHHVDKRTKRFGISAGEGYSWHALWDELAKCVPLCRRCHSAVHRKRPDPAVWIAMHKWYARQAA